MTQAFDRVMRIAAALPFGIERDRRADQVDRQPETGIGFRAPGVSVGVGVGNDRW